MQVSEGAAECNRVSLNDNRAIHSLTGCGKMAAHRQTESKSFTFCHLRNAKSIGALFSYTCTPCGYASQMSEFCPTDRSNLWRPGTRDPSPHPRPPETPYDGGDRGANRRRGAGRELKGAFEPRTRHHDVAGGSSCRLEGIAHPSRPWSLAGLHFGGSGAGDGNLAPDAPGSAAADVAQRKDSRAWRLFITASRDGILTGWRH